MTFSSRKKELADLFTITIPGTPIETVEEYKDLGTIFDNHLSKRKSFSVSKNILLTIYNSVFESVVSFSFCWFNIITLQDRNHLHNNVSVCSKIIGLHARSLTAL